MSAIDLFALSMLGILGLALLILFSIILIVRKNASREPDEVDQLIEESQVEAVEPAGKIPQKRHDWEKDPDWWRE